MTYANSWQEWKELIIKTFPDHHDFATTLKKLVNRSKQTNESWIQYYFSKMDLIQACKITDRDAVSCLIDGMNDRTLQNGAKAGRYENPEALFTEYLSTRTNDIVVEDIEIRERFDRRRLGPKIIKKRFHPYNSKPLHYSQEVRCYNCRNVGHVSSRCPKPRLECNKCKLLGHDESRCRKYPKIMKGDVKLIDPKSTNTCYFIDCEIMEC